MLSCWCCALLQDQLGDNYQLFLLQDKDDKPTVIVLPEGAGTETISRGQVRAWAGLGQAMACVCTAQQA